MKEESIGYMSPLTSFDIYLEHYHKFLKRLKKDADVKQLQSMLKEEIRNTVEDLVRHETYDALVITDMNQNIVWVNNGFQDMTGYSKKHAIGKRPTFLQGPGTSKAIKQQIREELEANKHFMGRILNYRKNGEPYLCQIKIVPIYDSKSVLVNFLALEKELLAA